MTQPDTPAAGHPASPAASAPAAEPDVGADGYIAMYRTYAQAVAESEATTKFLAEQLRNFRENVLPEAMRDLGVEELVGSDGARITVGQRVYVSIPVEDADKRKACFEYMLAQGAADLITATVSVTFPRRLYALAQAFRRQLDEWLNAARSAATKPHWIESALPPKMKADTRRALDVLRAEGRMEVHPATLKKWASEELAAGRALPDYFGCWAPQEATLTEPKAEGAGAPARKVDSVAGIL